MADNDPIALLIPWYVNGTIGDDDRRRVEEHLPTCDHCRSLVEDARRLEGLGRLDPDLLWGHVQARHLERFAMDPAALEPELASWIESHVDGCEACAGAAEVLRLSSRAEGATPTQSTVPGQSSLASLWQLAARTVLHPAAAAVYLLLVAVSIPAYRSLTRLPGMEGRVAALEQRLDALRDWGGVIDLPVVTSPLRGAEADLVVTRTTDQPVLGLGIAFEVPELVAESSRLLITLVDGSGAGIWSDQLTAGDARRHLSETGLVTLLIPADRVQPGKYRLTVESLDGAGRRWLDAGLEVLSEAPQE
jgi:predicted anti-sigma-YlaC factor YlaD